MILKTIIFFVTFCFSQITSLEEDIIYCLEINCNDYTKSQIFDSQSLGDLTSKQFTLQFFIRITSQTQNGFIALVQTGSYSLYIAQSSSNQILIQNTYPGISFFTTLSFKTKNWLAIYITQKNIIIQDHIFSQIYYYNNFVFNSNTKFTLFNDGSKYWSGQACCITMYLGINYFNNYISILYNNKKPEAKLIINIQQEDTIQYTLFDHSDYSYIVRMGEKFARDQYDPIIQKDYLQFSSTQYIYANDVQLQQQYSFEFRIALSSTFTSNVILLNYTQPNFAIFIYLNGTKVNFKQNDINQEFSLQTSLYYHFCIAVIQNLEETLFQYNINFYQFSDSGIFNSKLNITQQSSYKIQNQIYGFIQLGSQQNQFSLSEYFELYHFRFYDGFFLDTTSSIDSNCAIYLNDRCIICRTNLLLSDQYKCVDTCPKDLIMTEYTSSHNQCTRQCKAQCASCSITDPKTCLTCFGNRIAPSCSCPKGYFEDYISPNCRKYLPEQTTQTGTIILNCNQQSEWQLQTVTFNYKYTIPPSVSLFLIGVNQQYFNQEINLYSGRTTESNFQINIRCSFQGQFYKIQWMSSLKNHLWYQEGSQQGTSAVNDPTQISQTPQTTSPRPSTFDTTQQASLQQTTTNTATRLLQTNQYTFTNPFTNQNISEINMITYPQILGWLQNQQDNKFELQVVQSNEGYAIKSANNLNLVKYSTIKTDFQSYNYAENLHTTDNSIQLQLESMPKSIKFVNIFQGMLKIDASGNFSLRYVARNSTFLQFSSVEQNILYGMILFTAVKCDSYCTFKDLYITSCNLNYTQCSCNEPTYYVNETNFCDKCDMSCFTCQGSSTNCISCATYQNRTLIDGKCICLDSQYLQIDTCTDCHRNCLTCSNSTLSDCLSCKEPKILNSNQCKCPEGYYLDTSFNCQKCHPSCLNCTNEQSSSCQGCAAYRESVPFHGTQICPCMKGYYEQETNCIPCSFQCQECINENQCSSCTTTRELIDVGCQCKKQYYEINQKECQQCPQLCSKCQSDTQCEICLPILNLMLKDNICVCEQGFYLNLNNECIACQTSCNTCQDSQICSSCHDDRYLVGSNCLCFDTFYEDENMNCIQCQQPCVNCVFSGNKCLTCDVGRYLVNDECICNTGYFQNTQGECQACMKICLDCINESSCSRCGINRVIDQCLCEDGYYESESDCKRCPKQCQTCNQLEKCTSCKSAMQLINNDCECLKGTYYDGNNCLSCNTQLGLLQKSCDMIKNCGDGIQSINEECDDGNQVNRDGCTDCRIDDGYQCKKKLLQQSFCYQCQDKCSKCQYINSKIICQQCIDGYFIQNNNCIICNKNCKHCTSLQVCTMCPIIGTVPDEDGKCPQCQTGEQLISGICQSVCGDGLMGQGEVCDFGEQNGSGGCSMQCGEQKGFHCEENICTKIPEKQIDVNYVNSTTKTSIQINYNLKANELFCQSFQIKIDNFTQNEFNYTFTIENEQCIFQFNYNKTITEQNLIRIAIPQTLSRILDNDPREIVIIPRKQIYYSESQIQQSKNVKSTQDQFKILLQFLGPLLALLGGFSYYLTILDILSWINNLYYINIQFPLNVQFIFQNSLWDDIQLFPSSSLPQFNQPSDPYYRESPPHFLEKGTDPLFINNTFQTFGLFGLLIIGYFLAQMLVKTLSKKTKINIRKVKIQKIGTEHQYLEQFKEPQIIPNKYQKTYENLIKKCKFFADNVFSYFIKLLNLCYLDLVSAIVLQLYCFDLNQISDKMILLNYILAYSSMILCLYMLQLTWFACNQHLILMKNKRFIQIYGTIFENIKINDSSAILYSFINLLRKSAYIITVVYFYNKPLFQTGFSCLISFINVGFIICYSPFDSIKTLILQGVPDFCIFLLMLVFTLCAIDDRVTVLSDVTRYNLGWIIISIILISILVQLFFILEALINELINKFKSLIKKIQARL